MEDESNEGQIIRLAQEGDQRAFEALFRSHYGRVYRTVFGMLGNEADAKDAAQQAWLKAWQSLDRYNHRSAFTTWLHRIAVNTALDALRKRKRLRSRFQSIFSGAKDGDESPPDTPVEADPAEGLLAGERARNVHTAIARLPEAQRTVLVLKEFEDYTYQEIADILGIRIGTVMSRLHLARKKLQTRLEKK